MQNNPLLGAVIRRNKEHFLYSPSSAAGWFACPGSIAATKHVRRADTEHNLRGRAVHSVVEGCLKHNINADNYKGSVFKMEGENEHGRKFVLDIPIEDEEVECANYYLETVRYYVNKEPSSVVEVEHRVTGPSIDPNIGGTVDTSVLGRYELTIFDYKHGFKPVAIEGNHQKYIYTLLKLLELPPERRAQIQLVRMIIVQPRSVEVGPRRKMIEVPTSHVLEFERHLREAIARTKAPDAVLCYGSHCEHCPGLGICAASSKVLTGLATLLTADQTQLSNEGLAVLFRNKKLIEKIFEKAESRLTDAMLAGASCDGLGLFTGIKHRKWRDEEAVKAEIIARGVASCLKPPTPAQLEKLHDAGKDIAKRHSFTPPGEPALGFAGDKRAPYVPRSPSDMFGPPAK